MVTVRISPPHGLASRYLRQVHLNVKPQIAAADMALALQVQSVLAPYPPATIANSSSNPTGRWYERGYGPRWRLRSGAIHGTMTSETLGRKWSVTMRGMTAVLGNTASYSDYVQSAAKQASFHRAHGWMTDAAAVEQVRASGAFRTVLAAQLARAMALARAAATP